MGADRKKVWSDGRHRVLTIHDGTRLTRGLVAALSALVDEAERIAASEENEWAQNRVRSEVAPRLVARSDGLALYVRDRRLA